MKFLPALRDAIHKSFAPSQGGVQLDSSLGNSTYLAIYTVFFIFLLFITYLENRKKEGAKHWPYIILLILNLVVLFYTQTRGAQVGFAVGIFISALIIYFGGRKFKNIKRAKNISLAIVIAVLAIYIGLISSSHTNLVKSSRTLDRLAKVASFADPISLPGKVNTLVKELNNGSSTYQNLLAVSGDGTFTSRILNIKMSLQGFKDRPILGWGQDNYFYVFAKHNDPRMYAQEPWFDRSHNVFMDWLIAAGAVGLISYLGLYVAAFYMMWHKKFKKNNDESGEFIEKALLSGLLVAYFVHNVFVFDNIVSYILFFIVLAYISVRFGKEPKKEVKALTIEQIKTRKILFVPVIVVGFILVFYFFNIRYIKANNDLIHGLIPNNTNGDPVIALNNSLDSFKKAIKIGGIAQMESREQLAQTTLNILNEVKNANLPMTEEYQPVYKVVSDYITETKNSYETLLAKRSDPRSLAIYTSFLLNIGDVEEALKYGEMAHQAAPKKQTITKDYVATLLLAKDYVKANQVAEQMYKDDPTYDVSKITLAITDIYNKKFTEGEKLLTDAKGVVNINQDVMEAYLTINSGDRLVNILNNNIKLNENDTNSMIILANVYINLNQKVKAIQILENLKKISPTMSNTIDQYIEKIKAE